MPALLGTLWTQRELVRAFVVRDLKSRYVGSTMGFFWSVIVPFIYLFVFMGVFSLLLKSRWEDGSPQEETALFMLVGILAWHAFAETLSRATNCLVENANLIQKVVFPSVILPTYLVVSSLVNMLIGMPIVIVGVYAFTDQAPSLPYLALPLLVGLQGVFSLGLGLFLSALNLYLRDTVHLIGVLILVWMFATPIFYPPSLVQNATVPVPGSSQDVEVWSKEDVGRRRIPPRGGVMVFVDEDQAPRQYFEVKTDLEGMDPGVIRFLQPRPEDDQPRTAMPAQEPPDTLDTYVEVSATLYTRETAQESDRMSLGVLLELNPMYWLINSYRRVIMLGAWPDPGLLLRFAALSVVVFALGAAFFGRHQQRFPDLL